jgi:hypothetical protein
MSGDALGLMSRSSRRVVVAGTPTASLHEGAAVHALHWPQSSAHVRQVSSLLHTWSPQLVTPGAAQAQAANWPSVHACDAVVPSLHVQAREVPAVQLVLRAGDGELQPVTAKPRTKTIAKRFDIMLMPIRDTQHHA